MAEPLIEIEQCGPLTTLQDAGRSGYLQFGVSRGGAMDQYALQWANTVLGNTEHLPALELTQAPHRFRILQDLLCVFTGGGLQPEVNGAVVQLYQPLLIRAGSYISCTKPIHGFRLYLAVSGGFLATQQLGSGSTDLLTQTGGHEGRPLRKHDLLHQAQPLTPQQQMLKAVLNAPVSVDLQLHHPQQYEGPIRVLAGPDCDMPPAQLQQWLQQTTCTVLMQSNRMGYRLQPNLEWATSGKELISSPVTQGTIQLTPAGEWLVLMADGPTIGGYPRVLQVIGADLHRMAQQRPGAILQFELVSLQQAEALLLQQAATIASVQQTMNLLYEN